MDTTLTKTMNLTAEQQSLLRQTVAQYKKGTKREFLWLRSSDGNALAYGNGVSIWLEADNDASDFERLAKEGLMDIGYTPQGTLRGKPTAQGIALVDRDFDKAAPKLTPTTRIRAFVSYSTKDKLVGAAVKQILERYEIDSFLAHDDLQVSETWRDRNRSATDQQVALSRLKQLWVEVTTIRMRIQSARHSQHLGQQLILSRIPGIAFQVCTKFQRWRTIRCVKRLRSDHVI